VKTGRRYLAGRLSMCWKSRCERGGALGKPAVVAMSKRIVKGSSPTVVTAIYAESIVLHP